MKHEQIVAQWTKACRFKQNGKNSGEEGARVLPGGRTADCSLLRCRVCYLVEAGSERVHWVLRSQAAFSKRFISSGPAETPTQAHHTIQTPHCGRSPFPEDRSKMARTEEKKKKRIGGKKRCF